MCSLLYFITYCFLQSYILFSLQMNSLNTEVNFLRKELESIKMPMIDANRQKTAKEIEKEADPVPYQNSDFMLLRQKRSASEGIMQI